MDGESSQVHFPDFSFRLFDNIESIGKGAFSSVVKARFKQTGQYYAIKIVLRDLTLVRH
jgi:serine/threonine protein kinase